MPTITFTLLSGKGKGPTYTFHHPAVTRKRAPRVRSGHIRVGLAKVAGWKMSPEGQRAIQSGYPVPTLGQILEDMKAFCDGELKRLRAKRSNSRTARRR